MKISILLTQNTTNTSDIYYELYTVFCSQFIPKYLFGRYDDFEGLFHFLVGVLLNDDLYFFSHFFLYYLFFNELSQAIESNFKISIVFCISTHYFLSITISAISSSVFWSYFVIFRLSMLNFLANVFYFFLIRFSAS